MRRLIGATTLFQTSPGVGIVKPLLKAAKGSSEFICLSSNKSSSATNSDMCTSFSLSTQLEWTQLDPDTWFELFGLFLLVLEKSI